MLKDFVRFINWCGKCQIFSLFIHTLAILLHSVVSPWPFYQWGMDILGPFPVAPGQLKFLFVAVDYFTKWVETEAMVQITAKRVRHFLLEEYHLQIWVTPGYHFR
ncbi:unnamed protein product [Vicia faba]|uniref:Integrase catalytic domain-containing protein n=1 Tax=Vicia faba TaxID=3906 RepID=A0AAV0Z7G2_VICFA|nr:unnamed protein product [Vicia faba]